MLLSLLVPCYNTEAFLPALRAHLSSLQGAHEAEVVFVDDGSSDDTLAGLYALAGALEGKFAQVRVLSSPHNQGAGAARNLALDAAVGEYVFFVDHDDSHPDSLLLELARLARGGADVVACSLHETGQEVGSAASERVLARCVIADAAWSGPGEIARGALALEKLTLLGYVTNKLYRREFLRAHRIRFTTHTYIEDFTFNLRCFEAAQRVEASAFVALYYSRANAASITRTPHREYLREHATRVRLLGEFLRARGVWSVAEREFCADLLLRYTLGAYHHLLPFLPRERARDWARFLRYTFSLPLYRELAAHMGRSHPKYAPFAFLARRRAFFALALSSLALSGAQTRLPALFDRLKRARAH